ncbi:MAG: NfeD family protein [Proteobacteria bacterium]|nr:NfeD family protein [Pseudomonadota bacterium]NOG61534.1 NfeD family protein [Pseudomonadota bacterium]
MEWLDQIHFWYWLIAAVVMIVIEMLLPLAYFLWMGISAFIVGLILFAVPDLHLLIQVIIFGVLSVVTLVLYKKHQKENPTVNDEPNLNRRGEQYVGRIFTLEEAIVNGVGKVKVDDSTWKVKGMDMPAGSKVRVMSVDGTVFNVETETMYAE